jgi:hypothetical protein
VALALRSRRREPLEEDPMVKSIVVLVGLIVAVAVTSQEASAIKRCAPLATQNAGSPTCKCTVQNYSTVADTGVNVVIYDAAGGLHSCLGLSLPPRGANFCHVSIAAGSTCGCVVNGEGSQTFASLSVTDGTLAVIPQAAVPCQ